MRDVIIREHLDMLSSITGIGFLFTNGGKSVTSSIYRPLDSIKELKTNCTIEKKTYINASSAVKLDYIIHRHPLATRALYSFNIGESAGSQYVVETDMITEQLFNRHYENICRTLTLLKTMFNLFEEMENMELRTFSAPTRQESQPKLPNGLSVIKRYRVGTNNAFYVCKLCILNLREILNTYGTRALSGTKNELYRLLFLYEGAFKDNSNPNPIHVLDDDCYYIIVSNIDNVLPVIKRISDNLVTYSHDSYVIPVKLGLAYAHYPTITDITTVHNIVNTGIDYLIGTHSENLNIINMHSDTGDTILKEHRLGEELRRTVVESKKEIIVMYQPKVDANTGIIIGAEGLIRWNNPSRGLVPPNEFIPLSERTGIIRELGRIVFETVTRDAKILKERTGVPVRLGVNVSAIQLENDDFVNFVEEKVKSGECDPHLLDLEITESVGVYDINHTISLLSRLNNMDITLSLDDFGTGFSSLTYMKNLPLDHLKIDKSFIDCIFEPTSFCKNIIEISKILKLKTVAEGVETKEQWDKLKEFGCDILQGYYFSKPVPFEQLVERVSRDYPQER